MKNQRWLSVLIASLLVTACQQWQPQQQNQAPSVKIDQATESSLEGEVFVPQTKVTPEPVEKDPALEVNVQDQDPVDPTQPGEPLSKNELKGLFDKALSFKFLSSPEYSTCLQASLTGCSERVVHEEVRQSKDVGLCKYLEGQYQRENCRENMYRELALIDKDPSLCEKLPDPGSAQECKNEVYREKALANLDKNSCDQLSIYVQPNELEEDQLVDTAVEPAVNEQLEADEENMKDECKKAVDEAVIQAKEEEKRLATEEAERAKAEAEEEALRIQQEEEADKYAAAEEQKRLEEEAAYAEALDSEEAVPLPEEELQAEQEAFEDISTEEGISQLEIEAMLRFKKNAEERGEPFPPEGLELSEEMRQYLGLE